MFMNARTHRPFFNRQFVGMLTAACLAALAYLPFSPAVVQTREMATMQLFFDQLNAEWTAAGRAAVPLEGVVVTSVYLDVRVKQTVDDQTWADLVDRIKVKRDTYRHVSHIRVSAYPTTEMVERVRFEKFDPK